RRSAPSSETGARRSWPRASDCSRSCGSGRPAAVVPAGAGCGPAAPGWTKPMDRERKSSMNRQALLLAMLLCGALPGLARPAQPGPSLLGKWYGMKEGSPMTAEFRPDGTVTFKVDANSNSSYTCRYRVDEKASPAALDLLRIH